MTIPNPRWVVKSSILSSYAGRSGTTDASPDTKSLDLEYGESATTDTSPNQTKLLSIFVVVLALSLFLIFLWFYFSPILRNRSLRKRRLTQLNEAQYSQVKAYAAAVMTPPPVYPVSPRPTSQISMQEKRISTGQVIASASISKPKMKANEAEEFMDPYVYNIAPSPSPSSLPAFPEPSFQWHSRHDTAGSTPSSLTLLPPASAQTLRPPSSLFIADALPPSRSSSFKGLPPLPMIPPIVILSNSMDSLTNGEVLVSPEQSIAPTSTCN